jgi:hypothetical protein
MGLDTSHGCWSGPYPSFMRWRCWVARCAGYPPLHLMDGFCDPNLLVWSFKDAAFPYWMGRDSLPIRWDNFKDDPLVLLLRHSDCDGDIQPDKCHAIAERLRQIAAENEEYVKTPSATARADYDGMIPATIRFANGLDLAANNNEPVEFH